MIAQNMRQRSIRPLVLRAGNPVRQLIGPDEIVAAHFLACGLSKIEEVLSAGEVEDALFGFRVDELPWALVRRWDADRRGELGIPS